MADIYSHRPHPHYEYFKFAVTGHNECEDIYAWLVTLVKDGSLDGFSMSMGDSGVAVTRRFAVTIIDNEIKTVLRLKFPGGIFGRYR